MPKTYTTVPDKATGDVLTESNWDTHIKDNINNILVPPMVKAVRTSAQTINDATATAMQFDAADEFDTDVMHDTVTNNSRITIQTTGVYIVIGRAVYSAASDAFQSIAIRLNGSTTLTTVSHPTAGGGGSGTEYNCSVAYAFTAGDYVELVCYQDNTANTSRTATGHMSACWIGRTS